MQLQEAARIGTTYLRRRVLSDLETPIGLFQRVAGRPGAFLLESAPASGTVGRYSFIGWDPLLRVQAWGDRVRLDSGTRTERRRGDAWQELRALTRALAPLQGDDLPPFYGGAVGYLGYDMARGLERLGERPLDDRGLPDMYFVVPRNVVAYDHVTRQMDLFLAHPQGEPPEEGPRRLEQMERLLRRPRPRLREGGGAPELLYSSISPAGYEGMVGMAKEAIAAGEIFQVVLSQRHTYRTQATPLAIYRALRAHDPSPYMFHLSGPRFAIVGSSPETLVRVRERIVTLKPIAGTRPRPEDPRDLRRVSEDLLSDPKERAEHLMLLDLGRNDVGRVAEVGSVEVRSSFSVEEYAHVVHIVSEVEGVLRADLEPVDALAAAFPAGTLTGAPKIRAMQLIDQYEPVARGPYGGALGYICASGDLDFAIAIRSIVMQKGLAHLQAGAGIVQDSDPAQEDRECRHKLAALVRALNTAGGDVP